MHYLSLIVMFKNESMNIREFIEHYIWQGVEHFYLIDNGSTDEYKHLIKDFEDKITLYYIPKKWSSVENYNFVFEEIKNETFWFGIVDMDEFIFGTEEPIVDFLRKNEQYSRVVCPWLLFGTCEGYDHPKSVRKGFIKRACGFHHDAKCFSRSDKTVKVHIHTHYYVDDNVLVEKEKLLHNHYNIQSREFWEKVKHVRGAPDGQSQEFVRTWDMFEERAISYGCQEDKILHDMVVKLENGQNPYQR
jgi:glycosyltransferase involved in cell wall biosynthesis